MAILEDYSSYPGEVSNGLVDISNAIPIGNYLLSGRYQSFRGFTGKLKDILVIYVNGYTFIIDGRNRARANFDEGRNLVPAKIKASSSRALEEHLFSISHFFIDEIPIKPQTRL